MKSSVNKALNLMNKHRSVAKTKGSYGEDAALEILKSYKDVRGGVILHSFTYPYASNSRGVPYPGNIHLEGLNPKDVTGVHLKDEIDLLYITPYRIFVIEVKARGGTWKLYSNWEKQNSRRLDKSILAQTEKHARHLYHHIFEYIPEQRTEYMVPLVLFVDKAKVIDSRNSDMKQYIIASIANNFKTRLQAYDTPLKYSLDTEAILNKLRQIGKGKVYK